MTRIQFASAVNYTTLIEPLEENQDKGIQSHNAVWAFFQNLAALLKICSAIFEYKINQDRSLYLNISSFNNWLSRHHITKKADTNVTNVEIANLVNEALGITEKEIPNDRPEGKAIPHLVAEQFQATNDSKANALTEVCNNTTTANGSTGLSNLKQNDTVACLWDEKSKRSFLDDSLLESAKPFIENPSLRKDLPQPPYGTTTVYLPKEFPIVLKQGSPETRSIRLNQIIDARNLCDQNNYQCLTIPTAQVYKDFIVESRLPIEVHHSYKDHIALYVKI